MTEITREQFTAAMDLVNMDGDQLREDYSGRGMYGHTCPAITADRHADVYAFMAALGATLAEDMDDPYDAVELAGGTQVDQMGLGIVAYWPGLTLTDA